MVSSAAKTVDDYVKALPADRREAIAAVRALIGKRLPKGYVETMQYGMPSWVIPRERYPDTYNDQPLAIAALASQKSGMSVYLMGVYAHAETEARLRAGFAAAGKKLDLGKSCVRFKRLDDLALDAIGDAIGAISVADFIAHYEATRASTKAKKPAAKAAKKPAAKKPAAKKPAAKKPAAKR